MLIARLIFSRPYLEGNTEGTFHDFSQFYLDNFGESANMHVPLATKVSDIVWQNNFRF
jgi:hypothetical protein